MRITLQVYPPEMSGWRVSEHDLLLVTDNGITVKDKSKYLPFEKIKQ